MKHVFKKVLEVAYVDSLNFLENKYTIFKDIYSGMSFHADSIKDEIEEAIVEIKDDNHVYLEDELGDIFWAYACFLSMLEIE